MTINYLYIYIIQTINKGDKMLWNEIKSNNINSAEFITIFFKIFSEEQLLNLLVRLDGANREQEKEIIQKDREEG